MNCWECEHFNFIDCRCYKRKRKEFKDYEEAETFFCVQFKDLKIDPIFKCYKPYQILSGVDKRQFKQFLKEKGF